MVRTDVGVDYVKDEQSLACYSNLKIFQITAAYIV